VGKPSLKLVTFKHTRELTLEKSLTFVSNVGKPTVLPVTFKDMKEPTMESSPMHVSNVGNLHTGEKPLDINNVEKPTL
jgi:hypothetical protein